MADNNEKTYDRVENSVIEPSPSNTKLLPCPFCGTDPIWVGLAHPSGKPGIRCPHCLFVIVEDRIDKTVGFWNRREPKPTAVAEPVKGVNDEELNKVESILQENKRLKSEVKRLEEQLKAADDVIESVLQYGQPYSKALEKYEALKTKK